MNPEEKKILDKHDRIIDQLFNIVEKTTDSVFKLEKESISFNKDLGFLVKTVTEIRVILDNVVKDYVKREEFEARFKRLQDEIDSRLEGANNRIDSKIDVDKFDEHSENIKEQLNSLIDNQKWVTRLIIGAVIMALLGLIFVK